MLWNYLKNRTLTLYVFSILIISLLFPVGVITFNVVRARNNNIADVEVKKNDIQKTAEDIRQDILDSGIISLISNDASKTNITLVEEKLREITVKELKNRKKYEILYSIPSIKQNIRYGNIIKPNDRNLNINNHTSEKGFIREMPQWEIEHIKELTDSEAASFEIIEGYGSNIIRKSVPVVYEGNTVLMIQIGEGVPEMFFLGKRFRDSIFLSIIIGFFAGSCGILLIYSSIIKKINKIKSGLNEMEKNIGAEIPNVGGELGAIVEALNKMGKSLVEKEKLLEQLRCSEKLSALGHLVSGVAHEMRNPIGIVKGTVQLMESEFRDIPDMEEYLKILKEQTDRQNNVIQELLDFARPQRSFCSELNVNTLINSVMTFLNSHIKNNNIMCELRLQTDIPCVLGDGEKLKQVFVNIIINACDAIKERGLITITTESKEDYVYIIFKDNGEGIKEEDMANIFNPFYTTRSSGTGLGLAISHRIIDSHGGNIEVESKAGEGTKLTVKLSGITLNENSSSDNIEDSDAAKKLKAEEV